MKPERRTASPMKCTNEITFISESAVYQNGSLTIWFQQHWIRQSLHSFTSICLSSHSLWTYSAHHDWINLTITILLMAFSFSHFYSARGWVMYRLIVPRVRKLSMHDRNQGAILFHSRRYTRTCRQCSNTSGKVNIPYNNNKNEQEK